MKLSERIRAAKKDFCCVSWEEDDLESFAIEAEKLEFPDIDTETKIDVQSPQTAAVTIQRLKNRIRELEAGDKN